VSEDGALAIVVIAMQGNPFSPDYFRARRRGGGLADPLRFGSMHVAVYDRRGQAAWAFHERPIASVDRLPERLRIGHSAIRWEDDRVIVDIDERTTPAPRYNPFRRPLRGRVVIHPQTPPVPGLALDDAGEHLWWPIAPLSRIEVELSEPALRFAGHGYFDANLGDGPLDRDFYDWSWMRARIGDTACLTYDVKLASKRTRTHAFRVTRTGEVEPIEDTWRAPLPRAFWGVRRHARVDALQEATIVRPLEDGPFYTRALVEARIGGEPAVAVHETLAAHRLRRRWVRFCTGYKMRESDRPR